MAGILGALADLEDESNPFAAGAPAPAEAIADVLAPKAPAETAVVMVGSTDWPAAAKGASGKGQQKKEGARGPDHVAPVVVGGALKAQRVLALSVGPCAGHVVAVAESGVFAWGQNASGQLGLGPDGGWCLPGPASAPLWTSVLGDDKPVHAAAGNKHTLVVYASGAVLACGAGDRGALGFGAAKADMPETCATPRKVELENVAAVAAGCDFSLACDREGKLYSWGWSEFGKLGSGSDGCYNLSDASIKLTYTAEGLAKNVALPEGAAKVVQVSAGKHHSACLTCDGQGYTWGDNGYGKLGHRDNKPRYTPTEIVGTRFSTLLCGDNTTNGLGWACYPGRPFAKQATDGAVYCWGAFKGTGGEGATHPVPNQQICGWDVDRCNFASGATHCALAGEGSAVAWAQSPAAFGQLGLGPDGPKSTYTAKQMDGLADCGFKCGQVTASSGQTHFLCDASVPVVAALPVWEPPADAYVAPPPKPKAQPPKKKQKT